MNVPMPRSRGSQIYLLLLVAVAAGLGLVISGPWRTGLAVIGVAFVVSSLARVVVPADHVGMLRVRGKVFDVVWTMLLGVSLLVLAIVV
ncbi:MAG: DUF3017 domain-containing protein, partial [Actinomycetales bacterium]